MLALSEIDSGATVAPWLDLLSSVCELSLRCATCRYPPVASCADGAVRCHRQLLHTQRPVNGKPLNDPGKRPPLAQLSGTVAQSLGVGRQGSTASPAKPPHSSGTIWMPMSPSRRSQKTPVSRVSTAARRRLCTLGCVSIPALLCRRWPRPRRHAADPGGRDAVSVLAWAFYPRGRE